MGGSTPVRGCTAAVVLNTPVTDQIEEGTLAFDHVPKIEAAIGVSISSEEARTFAKRLARLLTTAEEVAPENLRAAAPIELTALMRGPRRESADTVYFVQARKAFVRRSPGEPDALAFSGWVRQSGASLTAIEFTAGSMFSDNPKSHPSEYKPLGILGVNGRTIWVILVQQFESSLVLVVDVAPLGIRDLVIADVGGC